VNYPTQKAKGHIVIGERNILFTTHEISLFATMNVTTSNKL
jgi:hypothetical protein